MDKNNNIKKIGTRIEVFHGKAVKTGGGLKKDDLKLNNSGCIVSVKASNSAKKNDNLVKAGYVCKKGTFGSKFVGGNVKKIKKSPKKDNKNNKNNKDKKDKKDKNTSNVIISKNKNDLSFF